MIKNERLKVLLRNALVHIEESTDESIMGTDVSDIIGITSEEYDYIMSCREMLAKEDLEIDKDIQIGDDPHEIEVYIELWCDVRKKLCVCKDENSIVDMYATYNPFEDTLEVDLVVRPIEGEDEREYFQFFPTDEEETLIKCLIAEKTKKEYNQTPVEFCQEFIEN